jgi:hypothetical protein
VSIFSRFEVSRTSGIFCASSNYGVSSDFLALLLEVVFKYKMPRPKVIEIKMSPIANKLKKGMNHSIELSL